MEIAGIILAILGLAFAFERPRKWLVSVFQKDRPELRHEFKIHTMFHAHNHGNPMGPLGSNTSERKYALIWTIWNQSEKSLQIERGIKMRQREPRLPEIRIVVPQHAEEQTLLPACKTVVLELELDPKETDHMRHWAKQCSAFGLTDAREVTHWVPNEQFEKFARDLSIVAKHWGLSEEVPEGKMLAVRIVKTPNNSLKADGPYGPQP